MQFAMQTPKYLMQCLIVCWLAMLPATGSAGIYDDILQAANQSNTAGVIDLLRRGMDVNTADAGGSTLTMIAARTNNVQLLDFLIQNRANLNRRNRYGDTALMMAALGGHLAIAQRLIAAGAETSNAGWAPLHYAAYGGMNDVLLLLTKSGAALDARAPNGQTALMLAASLGHLEAVRILIDADADMDLQDYDGRSALVLARRNKHTKVVEFLLESGAVE